MHTSSATNDPTKDASDTAGERVARNCAYWSLGQCENCGVPWQFFEVDGEFKCPHFTLPGRP